MPGGPGLYSCNNLSVQLTDEQQAYRRQMAEAMSKWRENGGDPSNMPELIRAAMRTKEQVTEHGTAAEHGKKYDDMTIKKSKKDEILMFHAQHSWGLRISDEQMKGDDDEARRLKRLVETRQKMMQEPSFWVELKHFWETACPKEKAKEGILQAEKLGKVMAQEGDFMEKILAMLERSKKTMEQQATLGQHQEHTGDPDWIMVNEEDEYVKVSICGGNGDTEQKQQQAQPAQTSAVVDPVEDWEMV
ncbi:MAG: hypothetical protein Q9183_003285 [Haloplaca sp. 2 TL-2023]